MSHQDPHPQQPEPQRPETQQPPYSAPPAAAPYGPAAAPYGVPQAAPVPGAPQDTPAHSVPPQPGPQGSYPPQPQPHSQQQPYPEQPYSGQPYPKQPYPGQGPGYPAYPGYPPQPFPPAGPAQYAGQAPAQYPGQFPQQTGPDPRLPLPDLPWSSSYRTPRTRWWKGLVSGAVVMIALLVFSFGFSLISVLVDILLGVQDLENPVAVMTPATLLATNLALAAAGATALVAHRFINGVRVGFFHSLRPGFRWRWLWLSTAVAAPVYLLFAASSLLDPAYQQVHLTGTAIAFLIIIVLTTPLQAAAEEYMFRGVIQRSAGAWSKNHTWSLVIGTLLSAVLFSAAHFAGDPWLIGYYFAFGVGLSVLAQLTGGLEAGIAIHTANNVFLLVLAAIAGQMDTGFDRSAGTGGPIMIAPVVLLALVVAGLTWLARRRKLRTRTPELADPAEPGASVAGAHAGTAPQSAFQPGAPPAPYPGSPATPAAPPTPSFFDSPGEKPKHSE